MAELPLRLVSAYNIHEHWAKKAARTKVHRQMALLLLKAPLTQAGLLSLSGICGAVVVTLIRIAPRELDDGDNIGGAFKAIKDGIADAFLLRDNDKRLKWEYEQQKVSKTYGVRIEIRARSA